MTKKNVVLTLLVGIGAAVVAAFTVPNPVPSGGGSDKLGTAGSAILTLAIAASLTAVSAFAQKKNPERNAYFGATHFHTSWPVDAWTIGNHITGPDDAYKSPNP